MKDKILSINNLSKTYHSKLGETESIQNISFDVIKGEILSIVGASGCGKSTLLNIISSLDKDYNGVITKNNATIGYMMQTNALFPWLTVLDNATLGLDITHNKTTDNINYVKMLLNKYGLGNFMNKYPHELSGGMQERVALIRTLALKPDILLLDEAFSSLDYVSRLKLNDDVYEIIKSEGISAIMITHDIAEAISISDRIIVLSKRPSTIKNIYKIELDKKNKPSINRTDQNFSKYYTLIWEDLKDE